MSIKLQKISELQPSLPFTEFDFQQKYLESFKQSELGRIHAQLPLKELAEKLADVFPKKHPQGNKHLFSPEGEVTLMFLKSYTGLSDDGLIELLNGNIHMQLFCGVLIDPQNPIKNGNIVSAIRNRLARCLNIKDVQAVLYDKWSPMLANKDLCLTDATCYESHLRYPADVKLLWESCAWLHTLVMEGSFGNQKQHYGVGRIAARNQFSETLLLFFGIHMANAATLAARELAKEETLKKRNTT